MTSGIHIPSRPASHGEITAHAGPDAPWLVMVHGATQNASLFERQVDAFATSYRILRIDLPGHGQSEDIPGPFGTMEYAASVIGAMDRAGISHGRYWGTHTGAIVGLLLACRDATRFDALILEGPFNPGRPVPSVLELPPRVSGIAREEGLDAAREAWWRDGRWFDVMRAQPEPCRAAAQRRIIADHMGAPWLYDGPPAASAPDLEPWLSGLDIPVLIINGEHDLPDFIAAGETLAARLPRAQRELIAGGGGFPLWEFPDRVNEVVDAFLNSLVSN